jgi:ADP-ribose pyrophosphatase YjhB (NUDIX family)
MEHNKDLYFVAVKIFLEDQNNNLLITKDKFGDWDIPGGRLRENDFVVPLEQVIQRKIKEELGDKIEYSVENPVVFMRHERNEILPSGEKAQRRIFAIGYKAKYLGGEVVLGKNHGKYEWVSTATFNPKDYFTGGWLIGVEEYLHSVHGRV